LINVGDLIICRGETVGIVLEVFEEQAELAEVLSTDVVWARVMWASGESTWEDIKLNTTDNLFKIIKG
jgi:hypothetical protein